MRPANEALDALQERLGHRFRRPELLLRALTHRSYAAEHPEAGGDSERLEFLGDNAVNLLVAEALYHRHPDWPPGLLSRFRSQLVRRARLAAWARELGLGERLRLGRGERRSRGAQREKLLEDAFEAVMGALYLDGGLDAARRALSPLLERSLAELEALLERGGSDALLDPKTRLQYRLQALHGRVPSYRHLERSGPDHASLFRAEVLLDGRVLGRGEGRSWREAERAAAADALARGEDGSPLS